MNSIEKGAHTYRKRLTTDPPLFSQNYRNASIFLVLENDQRSYVPLAWALSAKEPEWDPASTSSMNSGNARKNAESARLVRVEFDQPTHSTYWKESLSECLDLTQKNLAPNRQGFSKRDKGPRRQLHNSYYVLNDAAPYFSKTGAEAYAPEKLPAQLDGSVSQVSRNVYERKRSNRNACISHNLTEAGRILCAICSMDFEELYGDIGRGYIHIHHVHPLGEQQPLSDFDPTIHLKPVCPNCHAMLHKKQGKSAFTLAEIHARLAECGSEDK